MSTSRIAFLGAGNLASGVTASGSYSCCFIDKDGKEYTFKGRASSYYKGSIERLCRVVAIKEAVEQCAADRPVTDMAAELDFTSQAFPQVYDIGQVCKKFPCEIGMLVVREKGSDQDGQNDDAPSEFTSLAVQNEGLTCQLDKQIEGDVRGYNLTISLPRQRKQKKPSSAA